MADTAPKKRQYDEGKRRRDKARSKTRVNLGLAFTRWREIRERVGMKKDEEFALFLMDSYLRTKSEKRPESQPPERTSSTKTCRTVEHEYAVMRRSPSESEQETCAAPSVQTFKNGKNSREKDREENGDFQEDETEEFSSSLSVGDGHYMVDLGSSSEFIVDEECILQLFRSCQECNRQCTVRKHVRGLKLVISQSCSFCQSCCKWTNLPDDDDGDLQINGKDAAHGQTNSATSPSSNSS